MAPQYESAGSFSEGLAAVKQGGRWGYIDAAGKEAAAARYQSAGSFSEGLAAVRSGGKYGYIDAAGKEVAAPAYDHGMDYSQGLAAVEKDGKWGYIDKSGRVVVPLEYDLVTEFRGDTAIVRKNGQYALMNMTVGGFGDVLVSSPYAEAIDWAAEKGISKGTSGNRFSPDRKCTTAEIITFLWRAKGEPAPSGTAGGFSDVKETDYYWKAAAWAKEQGLVSGSRFNPGTPCSRGTTMMYLWKLAGSPAAQGSGFTDVPAGAEYAQAVAWAVREGITNGTSASTFSPGNTCTRGQIMTFLYRDLG